MAQMAELGGDLCQLPPAQRVRFFQKVLGVEDDLLARANREPRQVALIQEAFAALQAHPDSLPASAVDPETGKEGRPGGGAAPEDNGITILTMHASKGLEFRNVYLPDLNEGMVPPRRAHTDAAIEEERRLFYVAMTRARDHLELLYVKGDAQNPQMPSRFLLPLGIGPEYE